MSEHARSAALRSDVADMTSALSLLDALDALFLRSNHVARGHVEGLRSRIVEMQTENVLLRARLDNTLASATDRENTHAATVQELTRLREAAAAVVAFHAPDIKRDEEACSRPMVALRKVLRDQR